MSWFQDAVSKWPSLSLCPGCRKLRGSSSRTGRGTDTVGRPGSAPAAGGRWRRPLSPRGPVPFSGILGFASSLPGSSHLSPTESSFASVLSGTRGHRSSRGGRRIFLGDLGSSDHYFPEAPSHLPAPRRRDWACIGGAIKVGPCTSYNQHWGLNACVTFRPCGLQDADAGGFVNLIAVLKCTEPPYKVLFIVVSVDAGDNTVTVAWSQLQLSRRLVSYLLWRMGESSVNLNLNLGEAGLISDRLMSQRSHRAGSFKAWRAFLEATPTSLPVTYFLF